MLGERILILVLCLGIFVAIGTPMARAMNFNDLVVRVAGDANDTGDATHKPAPQTPRKPQSFIDPAYPLFACMGGFSIGAATVAFPPVQRWVYVFGALPGMASVAMRGGFGCYFGLVLGSAYSATLSTGRVVKDWWFGLFH